MSIMITAVPILAVIHGVSLCIGPINISVVNYLSLHRWTHAAFGKATYTWKATLATVRFKGLAVMHTFPELASKSGYS